MESECGKDYLGLFRGEATPSMCRQKDSQAKDLTKAAQSPRQKPNYFAVVSCGSYSVVIGGIIMV